MGWSQMGRGQEPYVVKAPGPFRAASRTMPNPDPFSLIRFPRPARLWRGFRVGPQPAKAGRLRPRRSTRGYTLSPRWGCHPCDAAHGRTLPPPKGSVRQ